MAKHAEQCPLCERHLLLTFHHLIPKKMHRRTRFRKAYTRAELAQGVWVCRECHSAIHRFFDEMTLARDLNTLALLQAEPQLQRHAQWLAKRRVRA
jgi:rubrerythrin